MLWKQKRQTRPSSTLLPSHATFKTTINFYFSFCSLCNDFCIHNPNQFNQRVYTQTQKSASAADKRSFCCCVRLSSSKFCHQRPTFVPLRVYICIRSMEVVDLHSPPICSRRLRVARRGTEKPQMQKQRDFCNANDTLYVYIGCWGVCADVAIKNPIKVTAAKLLLPSILRRCEMQFGNLNYV
jgi:hypothetical protein